MLATIENNRRSLMVLPKGSVEESLRGSSKDPGKKLKVTSRINRRDPRSSFEGSSRAFWRILGDNEVNENEPR
jgi:hypothetical protein